MNRTFASTSSVAPCCCSHRLVTRHRLQHLNKAYREVHGCFSSSKTSRCQRVRAVVHCRSAVRASSLSGPPSMKVGFVGLGIMGQAMVDNRTLSAIIAAFFCLRCQRIRQRYSNVERALQANNLIAAGYDVTVWNRNKDKCKPYEEKGCKVRTAGI